MSATASAAPRSICSPNQAFLPVIGPAMPIRTSARAGPPSAAASMTIGYGDQAAHDDPSALR